MPVGKTGKPLTESLQGISDRVRRDSQAKFQSLYGLLNEQNLIDCYPLLKKKASPGVDKVTVKEYGKNLEVNVSKLVERLKRKGYRTHLVKRSYIPKGNGKKRPLGLPVVEDKLLQLCVSRILNAIYEPLFLDTNFGYRPKRSPHDALHSLEMDLQYGSFTWIVDADIESYFDTIDHDKLLSMLEYKIADKPFIKLIRKWLKAGILDVDGKIINPATGCPQGGIVSPILSNIYLHFVLDLWIEKRVKPKCQGYVKYIRFADDSICAFQYLSEAKQYLHDLKERLSEFGLKLSEAKTRLVKFNRFNRGSEQSFDYLGFTFRWYTDYQGKDRLSRKTCKKKLVQSIRDFTEWIQENRHKRMYVIMPTLARKYRGYFNYYARRGNAKRVYLFYSETMRILFKWLNRRSQRKSYSWVGFKQMIEYFKIPRPVINMTRADGTFEFACKPKPVPVRV